MKLYIAYFDDLPGDTSPRDLPSLYETNNGKVSLFKGTEAEVYKQLFIEDWTASDCLTWIDDNE